MRLNFRQSLMIGTSALALNMSATGVAILLPQGAEASCLTVSSNTTISSSTNCIIWSGANISITNTGSIAGAGTTGILNTGAPVGNLTNNGVITSVSNGAIQNNGSIGTITNGGTISALGLAILNNDSIGSIGNSGLIHNGISNTGTIGGISNLTGGIINGVSGISSNGRIGSIVNNGTITGSNYGINNLAGGTIGGASSRAITNTRTLSGLNNSGLVTGSFWGIESSGGGSIGSITNATGGRITGQTAINVTNSTIGTITNSGTIAGNGSGNAIFNYNIGAGNASIGLITNNASSTISGGTAAIFNYNSKIGSIANSGVIHATGTTGNAIYNASGATIGAITNSGQITGAMAGINNLATIGNGGLYGIWNQSAGTISGVINSSLITGSIGFINDGSIGTISNSGTVTGTGTSREGLYTDGTIGLISNSGLFRGGDGIYVKDGSVGTIANATGGIINGTTNVGIKNSKIIGAISNSGTISGINGGIENSGTIGSGTRAIVNNGGTIGNITNSGLISSTQRAIDNQGGGTIGVISNSGTIGTNSAWAIYNGTIGTVANIGSILNNSTGLLTGNYDGVYNVSNITNIENDGTISSVQYGIDNRTGSIGTITNAGVIHNASYGIGNGLLVTGSSIGTIINTSTGTISGNTAAIINYTGDTINAVVNSGTLLAGGPYAGIYNAGYINNINNNGTISASYSGIGNTGGTIGTLTNSGIITSAMTAVLNNNSASIGTLINTGRITGDIVSDSTSTLGAISNSGFITGNINVSQNLTITGGNNSSLGTLQGSITANNLLFDNNAYQMLLINMNVGSGTVTNNGTLQLAEGGPLTITGNYSQSNMANLISLVTDANAYGSMSITGNANMAGDHISLTTPIVGHFFTGETFTIVRDAGTANYSGITAAARGYNTNVTSSIIGGVNDLIVTLGQQSNAYHNAALTAGSGAAAGVGTALDQLAVANNNQALTPLFDSIDALGAGTPAQINAIKQLAPSQIAAMTAASDFLVNQNIHVVSQHQKDMTQASNALGQAAGSGYQTGTFWGQVSGGFANRETTGQTDGFHQTFGGFATGVDDHLYEDSAIGVAVSWMQGRATGSDGLAGSNLTTNSVMLTGYGTQQFGPAFINAMAGASYNMYNQGRYISLVNSEANSNYDGWQYMGRIDGGWNFPVDHYVITPVAGIQAIRTENSSYTESGAGVTNLSVGRLTANTVTTLLGAQATTKIDTALGALMPEAKLQWAHDLTQGPISSSALLGGVSFSTETLRESSNGLLVTLDATLERSDHLSLKAEYDGDIRSNFSSHAGLIKAGWDF